MSQLPAAGAAGAAEERDAARRELAFEPWEIARERRLRVAEVFLSVQGEGSRIGLPTTFLRLTGCALRCRWCDTTWAFVGGEWRNVGELAAELIARGPRRLCVTGGEPLLQLSVVPLMRHLIETASFDVSVETGGDQDISVLPERASAILDIKLSGSGMAERMDPANVSRLRPQDEVKLVIASRADYEEARAIVRERLGAFPGEVLFSPVKDELDPALLAGWILEDQLPVRMQLQLHKLLWPGLDRGV